MSTEQEDTALLLELEHKITHRIRKEVLTMARGFENTPQWADSEAVLSDDKMLPQIKSQFIEHLAVALVNNPTFMTTLVRGFGDKMNKITF